MRLTSNEVSVFISVLSAYLDQGDGRLFLYGSRIDDALKGGDIDLLVVLRSSEKAEWVAGERHHILKLMKDRLGERRIDLSIVSESESLSDPFYRGVLSTAILLKEY